MAIYFFLNIFVIGSFIYLTNSVSDFPYHVNIHMHSSKLGSYIQHYSKCSGALLTRRHIITAAHCINDTTYPKLILVYAGNYKKYTVRFAKQVAVHKDYVIRNNRSINDIGVIWVSKPFDATKYISPISLSKVQVQTGDRVKLSVFDENIGSLLRYDSTLISRKNCSLNLNNIEIMDSEICVRVLNISACKGDSGSPLINYKKELVGLVSWGAKNCAKKYPDVYTNIFYYNSDIENIINSSGEEIPKNSQFRISSKSSAVHIIPVYSIALINIFLSITFSAKYPN